MNLKYAVWFALLLCFGCGEDDADQNGTGNTALVLSTISVAPTSFTADSGTANAVGVFLCTTTNVDLDKGILRIGDCGEEPIQTIEIPFRTITDITISAVAFKMIEVQFQINSNCSPGEYSAFFYVRNEAGSASNQVKIKYSITI